MLRLLYTLLILALGAVSSTPSMRGQDILKEVTIMGLQGGRNLEITDFLNALLEGFELEIDANGVGLTCSNFGVGDISFELSEVTQVAPDLQRRTLSVSVTGILARCQVDVIFNPTVESTGTGVFLAFNLFSPDFDTTIPTRVEFDDSLACPDDIIDLQLSLIGQLESIINNLVGEACGAILELIATFTEILSDNVFVDLAGVPLPVQYEDVVAAVAAEEPKTESQLSGGFEFFDEDKLDAAIEALIFGITQSPLAIDLFDEFQILIAAALSGDTQAQLESAERLLFILLEQNIEIPPEVFFDFNAIDTSTVIIEFVFQIFNGQIEFEELVLTIFEVTGIEIPNVVVLDALLAELPQFIVDIIESTGILDPIREFLIEFGSELVIPEEGSPDVGLGFTFSFTIGDLLGLIPVDNEITAFIASFGLETEVLDAIPLFIEFTTLGDLAQLVPELEVLLALGADTTIGDLIDLVEIVFEDLIQTLESEFQDGFTFSLNDPVPDFVLVILNTTAAFVPEVADILFAIEQGGGTFLPLAQLLSFSFALEPLADLNITFAQLDIAIDAAFLTDILGPLGESSLALPGFDLFLFDVTAGALIEVATLDGNLVLSEILSANILFDFLTQFAPTIVYNWDNLINFGFEALTSVNTLGDVLTDYALCTVGSLGASVAPQSTDTDLTLTISSDGPDLGGFVSDFANALSGLYDPAVATIILNFLSIEDVFVAEDPQFQDACRRNALNVGNNDQNTIIEGVDDLILYAVAGAVAVVIFALFATGIRAATKGKSKKKEEEEMPNAVAVEGEEKGKTEISI